MEMRRDEHQGSTETREEQRPPAQGWLWEDLYGHVAVAEGTKAPGQGHSCHLTLKASRRMVWGGGARWCWKCLSKNGPAPQSTPESNPDSD